jgi:ADP-heptose:LPS heptosyltransferase
VALSRDRRDFPQPPQILVLRALGLGDLLTVVPALRALRRAFPGHRLLLAAPVQLEPLVRLGVLADLVLDTRGLQPIGDCDAPELAVNLHGKGPQSHLLLAGHRPGRLVAFGNTAAHHAGPRWRDDEHEVIRWCRLLEEDLGLATDPGDLALPVPDAPAPVPGAVVLHPGAAYPARRWPADRFAEVARWAAGSGHPVAVTGGPDEADLARYVVHRAGLPRDAALAGRTEVSVLAAQVAAARLVICGDTGVAHLATAFGTPSVLLFGPTPPDRWGPPAGRPHTVIWHGQAAGDPWGSEADPALCAITVDEVVSAAERRLSAGRTTPASA